MQSRPAGLSDHAGSGNICAQPAFKKRSKIVFFNPTEITNWNEIEGSSAKVIHHDDFMKYENMLRSDYIGITDTGQVEKKKRGRPKGSKNGIRKRPIDPTQPWLEADESDELDMGLENEIDDDEYFRRLEEEKLREDAEEESRRRRMMRARAVARVSARGHTPGRRGRPRADSYALHSNENYSSDLWTNQSRGRRDSGHIRTNYAALAGMTDLSDSEDFGDQDSKSWNHNQELHDTDMLNSIYEQDEEEFFEPPSPQRQTILDLLPPPPSPTVSIDEDLNPSLEVAATLTYAGALPTTTDDPHILEMLEMDPIELRFRAPPLLLPPSANDLLISRDYLLDVLSIYEILRRYGRLLRISPFRLEDFIACLIANENSNLLSECHIVLLKALLREDDANGTTMSPMDSKDSVNLSFHLLDGYNWSYLLAQYLLGVKNSEMAAYAAATSLTSLSLTAANAVGVGGGPTGSGGADNILTAALFPHNLIPLDVNYPFVPIRKRLDVLKGLTNLFLATGPVRGDILREGFLPHEDYCRVCHQSGEVLCCDGCTAVFHLQCLNPPMSSVPTTSWICPVCVRTKTPGVSDCISEAERLHLTHRHEPIGRDRAGRVYWYISRRLIVEPINFTEREPELMDFMDGVCDNRWEQEFGDELKQNQLNQNKEDDEAGIQCTSFYGNPSKDYANESVMYYSSVEQVQAVRQRLHTDWEPWLCERLDALMSRMVNEMSLTQKLVQVGLGQFCQLRVANPNKSTTSLVGPSRSYHALMNLSNLNLNDEMFGDDMVNVFAVFEAEQLSASSNALAETNLEHVLCASELDPIDLPVLPILSQDISVRTFQPTVFCVSDGMNCLVRNQDEIVQSFQKPKLSIGSENNSHFVPDANELFALKQIPIPSVISPIPNLMAYRLSDEGLWRSWINVYTSGVMWSNSSNGQGAEVTDESPSKHGCKLISKSLADAAATVDTKGALDPSQVNMALTKVHHFEDKEKRRILATKFNFSDFSLSLWIYMDWPHLIQTYKELYSWLSDASLHSHYPSVKMRWPLNRLDKTRIECWSMYPMRLMDVLKLTICYVAAQIPLALFTPAWRLHCSKWMERVLRAQTPLELTNELALFESSLKAVCFQRAWFTSLGHWTLDRLTMVQREEDKRSRQLDRTGTLSSSSWSVNNANGNSSVTNSWFVSSNSNANANSSNMTNSMIRTKTPRPVRHTVWKTRGEEYRRLGGDGWMWIGSNRPVHNTPANPTGTKVNTGAPLSTSRRCVGSRGLQHGVGWGVCQEYLQGQTFMKPPKASECRGHVLHPITGIPLYLNVKRQPYFIDPNILKELNTMIRTEQRACWLGTKQKCGQKEEQEFNKMDDEAVIVDVKMEEIQSQKIDEFLNLSEKETDDVSDNVCGDAKALKLDSDAKNDKNNGDNDNILKVEGEIDNDEITDREPVLNISYITLTI